MPRLERYPFEQYDPVRRRWIRARWKAEIDQLGEKPFRILGPPEVREAPDDPQGLTCGHVQGPMR